MSLYARVLDGQIIETRDHAFNPPVLSPNKGAWVAVVDEIGETPEGQVIASYSVALVDGVPTRTANYEAAPRRVIRKSTVQERVHTVGKLDDMLGLLLSPGYAIYYARWFAPDWPNVYADDADMLAMLAGVGCTQEQIAVITA